MQQAMNAAPADRAILAELAAWADDQLCKDILPYWTAHARDRTGEGFLGEITADDRPVPGADRTVVMVSRHLWTFSAAARELSEPARLELAAAAFDYLRRRFLDPVHGGFFWSVAPDGRPAVRKKQIYGQAFALYALSEYARCPAAPEAERAEARRLAAATYELLEANARDRVAGGYREALAEDWRPTADRVLSPVDLDCAKSMNTNLHVLEALANYFRLDPTPRAREAIESLLAVHAERIRQADGHLGLFFNDDWSRLDAKVSYGHDIEASWLMDEAAEAIGAAGRPGPEAAAVAALAASALAEGYDPVSGGLDDEAESSAPGARRSSVRIWWCQAEALVGFLGAWQRTGDSRYLAAARGVRGFIEERIRDRRGGDWRWGVDAAGAPLAGRPKGGNWKTGYHNGRCCMEIRRRTAPYLIGGSL